MSNTTGTWNELLYSSYQAATTTTPTAAAVSMTAGMPTIVIPGNVLRRLGDVSSSLKLKMGGLLTATATIPTFTFGASLTTVQPPAFSGTTSLFTTAAITPNAGTNFEWTMEVEIGLRTLSSGAASTVIPFGSIKSPAGFPSPFEFTIPTTGTVTGFTTWENDIQYYLWPYLTLSAATAGNTVTVQYAKLYGEN